MKKKKEVWKDKYWICPKCAEAKGWQEPEGAVTGIMGTCGWCKGEKQVGGCLIPTCDYGIPRQRKPIPWD